MRLALKKKVNKIEKSLASLTKIKGEKTYITNIRNEMKWKK